MNKIGFEKLNDDYYVVIRNTKYICMLISSFLLLSIYYQLGYSGYIDMAYTTQLRHIHY